MVLLALHRRGDCNRTTSVVVGCCLLLDINTANALDGLGCATTHCFPPKASVVKVSFNSRWHNNATNTNLINIIKRLSTEDERQEEQLSDMVLS
jgi:hypothetical protein